MPTEIAFLIVGFLIGIFDEHFRNMARGVWKRQWGEVWQGMKAHFFRHYVPLIAIIALLLVGSHFYESWQQDKMVKEITDTVIGEYHKMNSDVVDRLDRLIEIMEANDGAGER